MVVNFSDIVLSIGNSLFINAMFHAVLSTVFSPVNLITLVLVTLGLPYFIFLILYRTTAKTPNKKDQKAFVVSGFKRNKSLLIVMFAVSLMFSILINKNDIVSAATTRANEYDKVCTLIAMKQLEMNYSDQQITHDMAASGCNPSSLPSIKMFFQMMGHRLVHPFQNTPKGTWNQREEDQT